MMNDELGALTRGWEERGRKGERGKAKEGQTLKGEEEGGKKKTDRLGAGRFARGGEEGN